MLHKDSVAGDIHTVANWIVADATALAALTVISDDIGKVAYKQDTKTFWVLSDNAGPAWLQLGFANTASVPEGTNLYFTAARVLATVLTGLSTATGTVVNATHTVLQAIGFLQKQVSDNTTNIAANTTNIAANTTAIAAINGVVESTGTFTPTIFGTTTAGANTYSAQTGFYVKHGKLVHVQGRINMTAKDAAMAGNICIGGLPFASITTANSFAGASIPHFSTITYPSGALEIGALVEINSTRINLYWKKSNASAINVAPADINATTGLSFDATYMIP